MEKGDTYTFSEIIEFAENHSFSREDLGVNVIGANFIVLENSFTNETISFVLVGTSSEYVYECIYSD